MPDFGHLWDLYALRMADGAVVTLEITAVAVALGVVLGIPLFWRKGLAAFHSNLMDRS